MIQFPVKFNPLKQMHIPAEFSRKIEYIIVMALFRNAVAFLMYFIFINVNLVP